MSDSRIRLGKIVEIFRIRFEKAKCMRMFLVEERDYWLNMRLGWQGDTVYRTRSNPISITFNGRHDELAEINGGIENNSRESD